MYTALAESDDTHSLDSSTDNTGTLVTNTTNTNTFSIILWNLNGRLSSNLKNQEFSKLINAHEILIFNETWTNTFSDIDIRNYKLFSKHRKKLARAKRDSGGICVYIRNTLESGVSEEEWNFEDGVCLKFDKNFFGWEKNVFFKIPRPLIAAKYLIFSHRNGAVGRSGGRSVRPKTFWSGKFH